jgi:hypothetical protein
MTGWIGTVIITVLIAALLAVACRKRKPEAPPFELPIRNPWPVSSCDHDFVDRDEMSNNDPRHLRCSKCGEDRYG